MKVEAQELSEQIKMRMEMGVTEIPDELIQKAEIIVHQVSVGFRNGDIKINANVLVCVYTFVVIEKS